MVAEFEPEIVFPDDPFEAAFIYLAVMAYPESGAGALGNPGSAFANSLAQFSLWACSKARGLKYIRDQKCDPSFVAPRKREFKGTFERGMRRVQRRMAAYDLIGTQLLQGFFEVMRLGAQALREGRADQVFHMHPDGGPSPVRAELWEAGTPSIRRILGATPDHWSDKLSLNHTAAPNDPVQKTKDNYQRAFLPSVPVLHMAHALSQAASSVGPSINGWEERDPITALLLNANLWILDAIEQAETWRQVSRHFPGMISLDADKMIRLVGSNSADVWPIAAAGS